MPSRSPSARWVGGRRETHSIVGGCWLRMTRHCLAGACRSSRHASVLDCSSHRTQSVLLTCPRLLSWLGTLDAPPSSSAPLPCTPQAYNVPRSAKNVGYGGSYSGNVAAYMRLRYPHTFHAVLASSSVVKFLFGTEAWERNKYFSAISIGNSLAEVGGARCQQAVAAALGALQGPLWRTKEGRAQLATAARCAHLGTGCAMRWPVCSCRRLSERLCTFSRLVFA